MYSKNKQIQLLFNHESMQEEYFVNSLIAEARQTKKILCSSPQRRISMRIFLQQSGEIKNSLIPAKYENFSGIFLHFYEEMGCIL